MCPERNFVKRCRLRDYSRCALTFRAAVANPPAFNFACGEVVEPRLFVRRGFEWNPTCVGKRIAVLGQCREVCRLRDCSATPRPCGTAVARAPASNLARRPSCRTHLFYVGGSTERLIGSYSLSIILQKMPAEGFEPPTYGLQNRCTTTVLSRPGAGPYYSGHPFPIVAP